MSKETTVSFLVPDIHCEGCVEGIRRAVSAVAGVLSVHGDATTRVIDVTINSEQIGAAVVEAAIAEAGFSPEPLLG